MSQNRIAQHASSRKAAGGRYSSTTPMAIAPGPEEGEMLHIVEVVMDVGHLVLELSQMRTWLDHMKSQVVGFRQLPGTNVCRVIFATDSEAKAFAQAFGGQILNRTAA